MLLDFFKITGYMFGVRGPVCGIEGHLLGLAKY